MLKRIITSLVACCVLFPALIFSDTIFFPICVAIVSLISLYEIFKCMGMEKKLYLSIPVYLFGIATPFLIRFKLLGTNMTYALIAFIFATIYIIYLFTLVVWSHGKLVFGEVITLFTMCVYIIAAMASIIYVRDYGTIGKYIYLLIFLGAWITDIFAYFTGFLFGKHKLIEDVSPKKTIEGSIGGIVFCAASFVIFGLVVQKVSGLEANLIFLAISGVVLSVVAQIGDLIMSVIKRHYGIKDYGIIFPGHGGMLDRFDSISAVSVGLGAICMFMTLTGITLL